MNYLSKETISKTLDQFEISMVCQAALGTGDGDINKLNDRHNTHEERLREAFRVLNINASVVDPVPNKCSSNRKIEFTDSAEYEKIMDCVHHGFDLDNFRNGWVDERAWAAKQELEGRPVTERIA